MTHASIEQLLQQLIKNITGLNEDSAMLDSTLKHAQTTLYKHKSTSTEEHIIDEIYTNLADKFMIKGYDELADDLTNAKTEYLNKLNHASAPQRILAYDMLSLLLALSDSPLDPSIERKRQLRDVKEQRIRNWDDVIREEALNGPHWRTWDDISSDDDDEDWDNEMDYSFSTISKPIQTAPSHPPNMNDKIDRKRIQSTRYTSLEIDGSNRLERLNHRQYWNKNVEKDADNIEEYAPPDSILHNAGQLNIALHKVNGPSELKKRCHFIEEIDAMREILFLLYGYETILFKRSTNKDGKLMDSVFYFDNKYSINHLSDQSFKSIMDMFCEHGNILYKLRRHVKKSVFVRRNGQTYQSFLMSISDALDDFERLLAELETKLTRRSTFDSQDTISLLQLQEKLQQPLSCLNSIYDTITECSKFVSSTLSSTNARSMATFLLSTLFNQVVGAQMQGNHHIYKAMLSIFEQTLAPYSRLLDDWIQNGSLQGDVAGELFVKRNENINEKSHLYWSQGFCIDGIELVTPDCPLFTFHFTNRLLFVGKTINLINKINPDNDSSIIKHHCLYTFICQHLKYPLNVSDNRPRLNSINYHHSRPPNCQATTNPFLLYGVPTLNQKLESISETKVNPTIQPSNNTFLFEYQLEECLQMYIDSPYQEATKTLLNALQQHETTTFHLGALSTIFLMQNNDLMHTFCEIIFVQMDMKQPWCDHGYINQAFIDACRLTQYKQDMTLVNIKVDLNKDDLNQPRKTSLLSEIKVMTTATYLDQLNIDYQIPWPINNFIKPYCLADYNKLMQLLLRIKRAKYVLEKRTLWNCKGEKMSTLSIARETQNGYITRLYALRMRMIWFVNAFWRYTMTTVLHADTTRFMDNLANIQDADDIPLLHERYLGQIIDKCLLNTKSVSIKKAIIHILDMVEQLADLFMDLDISTFESLDILEKDYMRTSEFITTSISIMGRKGNLEWFDLLSASLSV
ncbi:Spc98 family-domain-containing protein [Halteromyces radiatus]|uniref:Spc98 family-domain-containing protein n=1 Tax=Halteromyces radiatus TaxID=101107 RepID=UPI00221F1347|nr:Spc98 family-domain-containing protein [Halteromyces radiatus]KAI8092569.1 Spc98 family-domain-containing protein [Halteromyces radiatus]